MDLVFGLKWIKSSYCLLYFSELGSKKERFPIKFQIAWHDNYSYLKLVSKSNNHSEAKGRNYCLWLLFVCSFSNGREMEYMEQSFSNFFTHFKTIPISIDICWIVFLFFKNGPTPASFSFIFGLFKQTLQIFTTNVCEKMSIQYTAPGFEPTTLGTWVSSLNH